MELLTKSPDYYENNSSRLKIFRRKLVNECKIFCSVLVCSLAISIMLDNNEAYPVVDAQHFRKESFISEGNVNARPG